MSEAVNAGPWRVQHWDRETQSEVVTEGNLTISVDTFRIVKHLSARALKSKSGKATAMHGAVVVKALNRRKVNA